MTEFETMKSTVDNKLNSLIDDIYSFCNNVNMIEFISYSALLSWISFDESKGYEYIGPLEFEYLMGIFLSLDYDNSKIGKGSIQENGQIIDKLKELISAWKLSNSFRKIQGKTEEQDINRALFEANLISTNGIMRGYSWYNPTVKIRNDIYANFDEYLKNRIGFNVNDISIFENIIENYHINKINRLRNGIIEQLKNKILDDYDKFGEALFLCLYSKEYGEELFFTVEDIKEFDNSIDVQALRSFLDFFSVSIGIDKNDNYRYFNDKNKFKDHPIIKIQNKYLIINYNCIQWCVQDRLEEIIKTDNSKWQKYNKHKSDYLENKTMELFKNMFPKASIYQSLYYNSMDGKRCELDGLIQYDNCILLIEAKSGIYSKSAKNGGLKRLKNVIYDNIEYAAYQANRAKEYIIKTEEPVFEDKNKRVKLKLKKNGFENIYLINVTYEYFAELAVNLKELEYLGFYGIESFPWSVSLSDLSVISDFVKFPNQFLHYIYFREKFSNKVMIHSGYKHFFELDIFGFYLFEEKEELAKYFIDDINESVLVYNLYKKEQYNIECKVPDFSSIYNEYYNRVQSNKKKPEKKYNQEIYNMVRQLEEYVSQGKGYTNFALKLLDLDNVKQNKIIECLHKMVIDTKLSHKVNIKSMPYMIGNFDDKPTYGITVISGYTSERKKIFEVLKATCIKNRYKYKYYEWLGLCIFVDDSRHLVNNFLLVRDDGQENEELEKIIEKLPEPKPTQKIPRNSLCPCGSGKKYKRCCGK